jgi:SAM-dependent methyltransferase
MSFLYNVFYQFGITPWEGDPIQGPAAQQIAILFDREEKSRRLPYGPALDLGCGSGIWTVRLAQRGWEITGIDVVPKAIRRARERAQAAGVDAQFVVGDVTALREAGVGSDFRFVLDFECFNHLNNVQRRAVGREVTAVAAPDATILMLVWAPGRRWPLAPGASRSQIEAAFPGWTVICEDAYAARSTLPSWLKNVDMRYYRLARA